jgi:hypothetical protein
MTYSLKPDRIVRQCRRRNVLVLLTNAASEPDQTWGLRQHLTIALNRTLYRPKHNTICLG